MSDIDFTPDYDFWWPNKKASKEDFIWILCGIEPQAIAKIKELEEDATTQTLADKTYMWDFDNFVQNLWPLDSTRKLLNRLSWNSDPNDFIRQAYQEAVEFPDSLRAFLLKRDALPYSQHLEQYRDHEKYAWKGLSAMSASPDTHEALAPLFAVEPKAWVRYQELSERQRLEPKTIDGLAPRTAFNTDDRWFFHEYNKFLKAEFPELWCPQWELPSAYKKALSLAEWKGSLADYVDQLHNAGCIFRPQVYGELESLGIKPAYRTDGIGWAVDFYRTWLKRRPLWTLKEAATLYLGSDPDKGREFINFGHVSKNQTGSSEWFLFDANTVIFLDVNTEWVKPSLENLETETSLELFIKHQIDCGAFIPTNPSARDELKFIPEQIAGFFQKIFTINPKPLALLIALEPEARPDTGFPISKQDAVTLTPSSTGAPGRPTAMHIVIEEMKNRAADGKLEENALKQAEILHQWYVEGPGKNGPSLGVKTIRNKLYGGGCFVSLKNKNCDKAA